MFSAKKSKSIVGLDIEAGSVAATEVSLNGGVEVVGHGVAPLDPGIFREGEVADPEALGASLKDLFAEHKLSRNVRLGIANQRVAVRTLRLPAIENDNELETAIRFQAQDHIPMPLDQAVLEWQVAGYVDGDHGQRQVEVVAVAARRDMLSAVTEALHHGGLRPVGIDLSAFGMIRALNGAPRTPVGIPAEPAPAELPPGVEGAVPPTDGAEQPGTVAPPYPMAGPEEPTPMPDEPGAPLAAMLYCNLGDVTNLAVVRGGACLFTRISAFGIEAVAQRLAERRELTLEEARTWLATVGLDAPLEAIEGEREIVEGAREALQEGTVKLADELRLSLDFYGAQEGAIAVEGIAVCGHGATISGLPERLQQELGRPFEVRRPEPLAGIDMPSAARLTLSYGLALEE